MLALIELVIHWRERVGQIQCPSADKIGGSERANLRKISGRSGAPGFHGIAIPGDRIVELTSVQQQERQAVCAITRRQSQASNSVLGCGATTPRDYPQC